VNIGSPAATAWALQNKVSNSVFPGYGGVDVFTLGTNGNTYRGTWDGDTFSWSTWGATPSGMTWVSKPAVASWLPGRFDVMMIDSAGNMWDCGGDKNVPWGVCYGWGHPAGATFTHSPGIVALGDQRLLVGARGSDGQAWAKPWHWGQNVGSWIAAGGALAGAQVAFVEGHY
jgi:hypothetical protein